MLRFVFALAPTLLEELEPLTDPPTPRPGEPPPATIRTVGEVVEVLIPDGRVGPFFKTRPRFLEKHRVLCKDNVKEHQLAVAVAVPPDLAAGDPPELLSGSRFDDLVASLEQVIDGLPTDLPGRASLQTGVRALVVGLELTTEQRDAERQRVLQLLAALRKGTPVW